MRRSTQREIGMIGQGRMPREPAADRDRRAQVPGQEPRDLVREQLEVLAGDPQVFGAHDLVDEAEGELEARAGL